LLEKRLKNAASAGPGSAQIQDAWLVPGKICTGRLPGRNVHANWLRRVNHV
jgi:hypothetical protein